MRSVISKSVDNPSVPGPARQRGLGAAYLAAALTAILLSLTANGFAGVAEESASANTQVLQPAHQRLQQALQQWANQHLASASEQAPVYRFALRDKRLAIPDCDAFVIDPARLIQSGQSPSSLAVDAACPGSNWQRKIRGRLTRASRERATLASKAPPVPVLQPRGPIEKGQLIRAADLQTIKVPPHRAPQSALAKLGEGDYYAARNLREGQTLLASDLARGQPVVVVVTAIPARTQITANMVTIRQQAVDVPRDAYGSFAGLDMLAANRLLHPGDIVRKRDLTKAKLIKRGQQVAVESVGNYFRIASELIALQDGFLGDQIKLRNPSSDRQVIAVVTGPGRARSL